MVEVLVEEVVAGVMVAVVAVKGVSVIALIMFRCNSMSKGAVFYENSRNEEAF